MGLSASAPCVAKAGCCCCCCCWQARESVEEFFERDEKPGWPEEVEERCCCGAEEKDRGCWSLMPDVAAICGGGDATRDAQEDMERRVCERGWWERESVDEFFERDEISCRPGSCGAPLSMKCTRGGGEPTPGAEPAERCDAAEGVASARAVEANSFWRAALCDALCFAGAEGAEDGCKDRAAAGVALP